MKKTSFLSRLGAKMALAAVALTSALFVGCSEEDVQLNTPDTPETPDLGNAICTISVNVINLTGEEMSGLTLETSGNTTAATVSGTTITMTAETIPAQNITITAKAAGYVDGTASLSVPALTQGQILSTSAVILMVKEGADSDYYLAGVSVIPGTVTPNIETIEDAAWKNDTDAEKAISLLVKDKGERGSKANAAEDLTEIAQGIYDKVDNTYETYDINLGTVTIPAKSHATVTVIKTQAEKEYIVSESNGTDVKTSSFTVVEYSTTAVYTVVNENGGTEGLDAPKYTINVQVFNLTTGGFLTDLSALTVNPQYEIAQDGKTASIVITGSDKIQAQTVTVIYPKGSSYIEDGKEEVSIPELVKGQSGVKDVIITVREIEGGDTPSGSEKYTVTDVTEKGSISWESTEQKYIAENKTPFQQGGYYFVYRGKEGDWYDSEDMGDSCVDKFKKEMNTYRDNVYQETSKFVLPHYSYKEGIVEDGKTPIEFIVRKHKNAAIVKEWTVSGYRYSSKLTPTFKYFPEHAGHCSHNGHGHGHGDGDSNAGGGIAQPVN